MRNLVLVDTSAWICFFARKGFREIKEAISILLDDNRVAIAGPILVELKQGAKADKERDSLNEVIRGLHWLTITDDHWHETADLSFRLRRKGITASSIDSLITAVALSYNCKILHKDRDFELIAKHTPVKLYDLLRE